MELYQTIEFEPIACFKTFADGITNARWLADKDPAQQKNSETHKLLGNSAYGSWTKIRDIKYVKEMYKIELDVNKINTLSIWSTWKWSIWSRTCQEISNIRYANPSGLLDSTISKS